MPCGRVAGSTELWDHLLKRTFPARLTGAPGPNAPPRLRRSNYLTLSTLSCEWVQYVREIRAVRVPAPSLPALQHLTPRATHRDP